MKIQNPKSKIQNLKVLPAAILFGALESATSLTSNEAYVLLTLCGDLEISQIVNSWATVRVAVGRTLFQA